MCRRKLTDKLIDRSEINEEIKLIENSRNDYITPSGKVYTDYGNNKFYPKSSFVNKHNGYLYIGLNGIDGKAFQRRLHRVVAETYLPNPDNLPIVMHKDNNKANPELENLKWGTVAENTKAAFDAGLAQNDIGFGDSQSIEVIQLDMNLNIINIYGSISEASRATGIGKTGIIYQCNHKVRTKPRCGYYFRYLEEYDFEGFVL